MFVVNGLESLPGSAICDNLRAAADKKKQFGLYFEFLFPASTDYEIRRFILRALCAIAGGKTTFLIPLVDKLRFGPLMLPQLRWCITLFRRMECGSFHVVRGNRLCIMMNF